jgi:hypothetical protein
VRAAGGVVNRRARLTGWVALVAAAGCSGEPRGAGPTPTPTEPQPPAAPDRRRDGATPTPMTCDAARRAIETRRFVGWRGLPTGCTPTELFDVPADAPYGYRRLGAREARQRLLDLPGYYRPLVTVRDDVVVLFDGMNPALDAALPALLEDLGEPAAKQDFDHGTLAIPRGEWIYPERGITLFVDTDARALVHVAVYAPTSLATYLDELRPRLGKRLR